MNKFFLFLSITIMSIVCLNSCIVPKKVVYFKDMELDQMYDIAKIPPIMIEKNDRVDIRISSKNPELALPFNKNQGTYNVTETGAVNAVAVESSQRGYLVDEDGNIDFPLLGMIKISEKSIEEVKNYLRDRLVQEKLIADPIVTIELVNMKILMMGEASNSIITVPNGKLNLLEAIAQSGGVTDNAVIEEVTVIREENGVRRMYHNDMQSVDVFNSPTFILKQNDIVYVKPRSATMTPRETMTMRYVGMFTGFLSLGITIWALLTRD